MPSLPSRRFLPTGLPLLHSCPMALLPSCLPCPLPVVCLKFARLTLFPTRFSSNFHLQTNGQSLPSSSSARLRLRLPPSAHAPPSSGQRCPHVGRGEGCPVVGPWTAHRKSSAAFDTLFSLASASSSRLFLAVPSTCYRPRLWWRVSIHSVLSSRSSVRPPRLLVGYRRSLSLFGFFHCPSIPIPGSMYSHQSLRVLCWRRGDAPSSPSPPRLCFPVVQPPLSTLGHPSFGLYPVFLSA